MCGMKLECIYCEVKVYMIGGGVEEVFNDFVVCQFGWV